MPQFQAPLESMRFVMNEVLKAESLSELEAYQEFSPELADQILEEGAKICEEVLFPLNMSGDQEGCALHKDKEAYKDWKFNTVTTPSGFIDAYKTFIEGGWTALAADPDFGGMGMPTVLNTAMQEMICAANFSFGMYPGLSHGAYDALHHYGTDVQKAAFLPHMVDGTWSGTMNLTEPHCGTDLGLIRSKAEPHEAGEHAEFGETWGITGQKIYISAGEHDLTENIVHLVLARLPNAPEGVKGISLFVVPKYMPVKQGDDWVVSDQRNGVNCNSIEHKMGIKASSTCVMDYHNAQGWLVGAPHKGLKAMFTMMNNARLGVAMQGLGIAEVATQNAVFYAKDRLQMRSLDGAKHPEKEADPIIVHPDVRRMLLTGKAFCEGARALSYWTGMNLDIADEHGDEATRQEAEDLVALMTPILKAYQTDMGTLVSNLSIQVHGGAGYISEYGVEQYARDARIAEIYEGTNGIQALDLVGRKMGQGFGRLLRRFFHPVGQFIENNQAVAEMGEFVFPLAKAYAKLQQSTATIAQKGMKDPLEAGAASSDYLRQFALVAMAYMWARMAKVAQDKLESGDGAHSKDFYETRLHTAQFFMQRMLPEADSRFKMVMAGADTLMAMDEEAF